MSKLTQKQKDFLADLPNMPERGVGELHHDIMGRCNRGINAGFTADELYDMLEPLRPWRPNELESTIQKAAEEAPDWQGGERSCGTRTKGKPKRAWNRKTEADVAGQILTGAPERTARIREALIQSVGGEIDPFGPEVRATSNPPPQLITPVKCLSGSEYASGMIQFLQVLYRPDDLLYIGNKYEKGDEQRAHIKPVDEWIDFFSNKLAKVKSKPLPGTQMRILTTLGYFYPVFCINPLTGESNAKGSFRSMDCVKEFRYVLVEADKLDLNQQIPLLVALELPIVALTYSGNKSIHALIKVDEIPGVGAINDLDEWKAKIKPIFSQLTPLGFDGATKDPVRPSRLPGIWRSDKDKFQQLLFLNPDGGFHV